MASVITTHQNPPGRHARSTHAPSSPDRAPSASLSREPPRTAPEPGAAGGYSLIEMLIVIVMLGILASIASPFFLKDRPAADVRTAADRVANTLRNARFRAVSMKRDVFFEFEPDGQADFYSAYADHDDDGSASGTAAEREAVNIAFPDQAAGWQGISLPPDVTFALGPASSSPDSDADAPGDALDLPQNPLVFEPRGTVRWPDGSTDPSGAVYLSHADHQQFLYAVVVMPTGSIKTWRYDDGDWR